MDKLPSRMDKEQEWTLNEEGSWEQRSNESNYNYVKPRKRRHRVDNARREWLREVDRQNQAILNKISTIKHRGGAYSQAKMKVPPRKKNLHHAYRVQEWDRIHNENQGILKRLNRVKPTLGADHIGYRLIQMATLIQILN